LRGAILALDRIATQAAMAAACLALCVAGVAGLWQVTSRFLLESPATWSEALVRTALIWMCYLGLAGAFRQGTLVSIDLCHRLSRGWLRLLVEWLVLSAALALLGVMLWHGWGITQRVAAQNLAGLDISIAWGYAAVPVGAGFCIIGVVAHFLDRRSDEHGQAV